MAALPEHEGTHPPLLLGLLFGPGPDTRHRDAKGQFLSGAIATLRCELSEQTAIRLHFGHAVGKEDALVMRGGDRDLLVAAAMRRIAEAVG